MYVSWEHLRSDDGIPNAWFSPSSICSQQNCSKNYFGPFNLGGNQFNYFENIFSIGGMCLLSENINSLRIRHTSLFLPAKQYQIWRSKRIRPNMNNYLKLRCSESNITEIRAKNRGRKYVTRLWDRGSKQHCSIWIR